MKNHSKYLGDAETRIFEKELLSREAFTFYKELFEYQEKYFIQYEALPVNGKMTRSNAMPLVEAEYVETGEDFKRILLEGLDELTALMKRHYSGMNFEPIRHWFSNGIGSIEKMIGILLRREEAELQETAADLKIGVDELIFILVNWLKPFFININEKFGSQVRQEDWYDSSCPVCGYYPDMEKIVESVEGKKYLHCALCEYEWMYKRIACSICGNENNETLGFFTEENKTPYRIDYCDSCKGYIKTLRMSKFQDQGSFDLVVENILTAYLDSWAMKRGYSRP